jgi:hypothetical protein
VVYVGVDVVHTDSVDTENLEKGGIAEADIRVTQRVAAGFLVVAGRAARLIGDTDDLEAVAGLGVYKVVALDLKRLDSCSDGCAKRKKRRLNLGQKYQYRVERQNQDDVQA